MGPCADSLAGEEDRSRISSCQEHRLVCIPWSHLSFSLVTALGQLQDLWPGSPLTCGHGTAVAGTDLVGKHREPVFWEQPASLIYQGIHVVAGAGISVCASCCFSKSMSPGEHELLCGAALSPWQGGWPWVGTAGWGHQSWLAVGLMLLFLAARAG